MSAAEMHFIDWFPNEPVELQRGRRYRIGRGGGNELYLPDVQASREHADITWRGGAFVLTDLVSSNGTYLNSTRVTDPVALKDGDEIRIGTHVLRVRVVKTRDEAERIRHEYQQTKKQVGEWQTVVGFQAPEGALSGAIRDVSLPQVIQMLEAGRKTGRLLVTAPGVRAALHLSDGRIVAAEHTSGEGAGVLVQGAEAVYGLLELTEGMFEFLAEEVTVEPTIHESPQALLMEGLRRLDEKRMGE